MCAEVRLFNCLCRYQHFFVAKYTIFFLDLESYIFNEKVDGFYLLCFPFDDFFFGVPVCDIYLFFKRNFPPFFINGDTSIDKRLFFVLLASTAPEVAAEGLCG